MSQDTRRIKIVAVGDGGCGKTSLLMVLQGNQFPSDYMPTVFENYLMKKSYAGVNYEVELWDTYWVTINFFLNVVHILEVFLVTFYCHFYSGNPSYCRTRRI